MDSKFCLLRFLTTYFSDVVYTSTKTSNCLMWKKLYKNPNLVYS